MSFPDRIWITSNGIYSKLHKSKPHGETSAEYQRVSGAPVAAAPAPSPKPKAPKVEQRAPVKRQMVVRNNRAAKPRVTKEKA